MSTRTSVYQFLNGVSEAADDALPDVDWNLVVDTAEMFCLAMGDLAGAGFLRATDFNLTTAGGLEAVLSGGRALIGSAGARKLVEVTGSETFSGLTPSTTYSFYVTPAGTRAAVASGGSVPAGAMLAATCATTAGAVTTISNLPAGRTNLSSAFGPRSVVAFNARQWSLGALDTSYRVELDFSAHGLFGDVCYVASAVADGASVIVQEDTGQKTTGKTAFILYVASESPYTPYGTYGYGLDVELTVTLAGYGWTGATVGPFAGTWTSPAEI